MTYEEWIKKQPNGHYLSADIFAAGAASRDAEIAELKAQQCTSPFANSPPCRGIQRERDTIAELVAALEYIAIDDCGCGVPCDCYSWYTLADKAKEALANTPKQSLTSYRNSALEEAAKRCQDDESGRDGGGYFAEIIRDMKEPE